MSARLWYPQLDVYDAARRLAILLEGFESSPGFERLFICDFFLANPPLLHRAQMTRDTRNAFLSLKIPHPDKTFLSYPALPLLFHKMEPIQRSAMSALTGKGLIAADQTRVGKAELTDLGRELVQSRLTSTDTEKNLVDFLVSDFAREGDIGNTNLRRRTGLRRAV